MPRPLVAAPHAWLLAERARMSKHNPVAKAINFMLEKDRWADFTRFLDDRRVCLTNNSAERALRGVALGRALIRMRVSARRDAAHCRKALDRISGRYGIRCGPVD